MQTSSGTPINEYCPQCEMETSHAVNLELVVESTKVENSAYSREPYRNTTCKLCGFDTTERMNRA